MSELDIADVRILAVLQEDARLTHEVIGDKVGLSPSAVTRRIKRLRESGVIETEVAVVNLRVAQPMVSSIVHCKLDRTEADTWAQFSTFLASQPQVTNAYRITGEFDFVIVVATRTVDEYQTLLGRLVDAFPMLRSVTTYIVLEQLKRSLALPIPLIAAGAG